MRFATLLLATLPLAGAEGIAGKWTIEGDVVGNPVALNCSLEQGDAPKFTGKCTMTDGSTVDVAGEAKDQKVNFSFTTASGYTLTYSGKLEGDTMKGDIEVSGASGTFAGKRSRS